MVQATDLRIGNWVRSGDSAGRISQILVSEIEMSFIVEGGNQLRLYRYEDIEAISLTPAIINACEFYRHELFPHRNAFHHPKFILNINIVGSTYEVSFGLIPDNVAIIYQRTLFLHQLQNLYYLLTNQELTVML